jgi:glycosyltransferase involved in cell wall biosynthesis
MLEVNSKTETRLHQQDKLIAKELQNEATAKQLRILWVVHLQYDYGIEHGGHIRFFNYARILREKGHEVYFAVFIGKDKATENRQSYFENLKQKGIISGYYEIEYNHPNLRGKLARLLTFPQFSRRVLQSNQAFVITQIENIIKERDINLCVISNRDFLFALPSIKHKVATIIDWCDSYTLFYSRYRARLLKEKSFVKWFMSLDGSLKAWVEERHYSQHCSANIVVSPKDKECLDEVNKTPYLNHLLLNGVDLPIIKDDVKKIENRIIFSGNMDFPPNYESAIWFIKNVMPLLLKRNPKIKFVVAGANPIEELRALKTENVEVTGFVSDIKHEIAISKLYVAPMVSGGGFKNKVVEAISSGTFVVATSIGVEFLDEAFQKKMLVADTPQEMANAIFSYLDEPTHYEQRLKSLQETIREEFTWEQRTQELIVIAHKAIRAL